MDQLSCISTAAAIASPGTRAHVPVQVLSKASNGMQQDAMQQAAKGNMHKRNACNTHNACIAME
jgi:hypothetical protein